MNRLLIGIVTILLAILFFMALLIATIEVEKAQKRSSKTIPTFFFRNHLPDALGVEYFKRVIQEDEVVTCYWIMNSKDQVLFHTCKQRSLYD